MTADLRSRIGIWLTRPWAAGLAMLVALVLAGQGARVLYPPDSDGSGWLGYLAAAVLAAFVVSYLARRGP